MATSAAVKIITKIPIEKFNGKQQDWEAWSFRFKSKLRVGGLNLQRYLTDDKIPADATEEAVTELVAQASAIYALLVNSLNDTDLYLIKNLPNWTRPSTAKTVKTEQPPQQATPASNESDNGCKAKTNELMDCPHPSAVWKVLINRYEPDNTVYVAQLEKKLDNLKMKDDFQVYVAQLEDLCARLTSKGEPQSDRRKLYKLLKGLPPSASSAAAHARTTVGMDYKQAIVYLTEYFALQKGNEQEEQEPELALAVEAPRTRHASQRAGEQRCGFCHKKNHTEEQCWHKHPEKRPNKSHNKNSPPRRERGNDDDKVCNYCTKHGHTEDECRTKKKAALLRRQRSTTTNSRSPNEEPLEEHALHEDGQEAGETWQLATPIVDQPTEALMVNSQSTTPTFLVDTGAQVHLCKEAELFIKLKDLPKPQTIKGFNGAPEQATQGGTIQLQVLVNGRTHRVLVHNVLYMPNAITNLLSATTLQAKGLHMIAKGALWTCYKNGTAVLQAQLVGKRLELIQAPSARQDAKQLEALTVNTASRSHTNITLWHQRLGHLNGNYLIKLLQQAGIKTTGNISDLSSCEPCKAAKLHRTPLPKTTTTRASEPLERIHTDICGPLPNSIEGFRYICTFKDDASRYVSVALLKNKSEFAQELEKFILFNEHHLGKKVKYIRLDNAKENLSTEVRRFCAKHGIKLECTTPNTPGENGTAERTNRTLFERARAFISESGLPIYLWPYAILAATDVSNNVPTAANAGQTPMTRWNGSKPSICAFKRFGCAAYVYTKGQTKFAPRSTTCVYLGRDPDRKAWKVWNIATGKVTSSRDVVFNEDYLPFKQTSTLPTPPPSSVIKYKATMPIPAPSLSQPAPSPPPSSQPSAPAQAQPQVQGKAPPSAPQGEEKVEKEEKNEERKEEEKNDEKKSEQQLAPLPQQQQEQKVPERPQQQEQKEPQEPHPTRSSSRSRKPYNKYDGDNWVTQVQQLQDPTTPEEALKSPEAEEWKAAMQKEMDSLKKNDTYELVDLPENAQVVKTIWVLRRKFNADGTIERYKARLCAKGYSQRPGLDYDETFAPVPQYKSWRTVLALAAQNGTP
jgi:hypothetical protein